MLYGQFQVYKLDYAIILNGQNSTNNFSSIVNLNESKISFIIS